jgi:hypothetical protein
MQATNEQENLRQLPSTKVREIEAWNESVPSGEKEAREKFFELVEGFMRSCPEELVSEVAEEIYGRPEEPF